MINAVYQLVSPRMIDVTYTAFYANPDLRGVRPPEEPKAEPAALDLASLVEQLQKSPELAKSLATLISAQSGGRSV